MKKYLLAFIICLANSMNALAQDSTCRPLPARSQDSYYNESCSDYFGFESALTFGIGGGYRTDQLKWDLIPNSTGTEIKEKWKNIQTGMIGTDVQFLACEHYLLQVDFDYGWFDRSGHQNVQTFTLASDTLLSDLKSRTHGRTYNLSGAIGYQFNLWRDRFSLAPIVGYSYHFQKFKNDRYANVLLPGDETFAGVRNHYTYRWRGPFVGLNSALQLTRNWQIYFSYEYHWARYRAKSEESFVNKLPFQQKANQVRGNEFVLGTTYQFCDHWLLGIKLDYKKLSSSKGRQEDEEGISNLRNLRWESLSAILDLAYSF